MDKFNNLVLGTADVQTYLAGLLFALIGLAFYYRGKLKDRDVESKSTPEKFSLKFFLQDNMGDLIFNILAILLGLRFSVEYAGVEVTALYSIGIGFGASKVIEWVFKIQEGARKNI